MFSVWFSLDRENYAYKDEIIYTFWRLYCINITVICIITMHETGCSFKWNGPLVLKERAIGRWGRFVFFARKGEISFSTGFLRWLFSFSITIYCVNLDWFSYNWCYWGCNSYRIVSYRNIIIDIPVHWIFLDWKSSRFFDLPSDPSVYFVSSFCIIVVLSYLFSNRECRNIHVSFLLDGLSK